MDKEINMEQVNGRVLAQSANGESQVINNVIERLKSTGKEQEASFLKKTIKGEIIKINGLTAYVKLDKVEDAGDVVSVCDFHISVKSNTNEYFSFTYRACDMIGDAPGNLSRETFRKVIFTMAYSVAELKIWSAMACEKEGYYRNILKFERRHSGRIEFNKAGSVTFWVKLSDVA